jgi:hypothetical protein
MAQTFGTDIKLEGGATLQNFRIENLTTAPAAPLEGQMYYNSTTKKYMGYNGTVWVDISQIVTNAITLKGEIANANTNPAFPVSPVTGDSYFITTTSGTVGGVTVEVGDQLIFGASAWFVVQANTIDASTTAKGVIRIATQAETNGGTAGLAVSPNTLVPFLQNYKTARVFTSAVGALAANTDVVVTHNLNLANAADAVVEVTADSNRRINIDVTYTSVNAVTIRSLASYTGVRVIVIG